MCKKGTDQMVTLYQPRPVSGHTEILVDACIAPLVQMLNDFGVHTLHSCCSHGAGCADIIYKQDGERHTIKITVPEEAA